MITAVAEDGTIEELGRIGLAKFLNPEGLLAIGNNLFEATEASGEHVLKQDEQDSGYGT